MVTKRTAQTDVREKFDRALIQEILEFPGGALYAITVPLKNGRNLMSYSTMTSDWHILYDSRYNDTSKQWDSKVSLWKRCRKEAGLSERIPKLTQKVWDKLDEKWKKDLANSKRRAAAADKKIAAEMKKRQEEEKLLAEKLAKEKEKERKEREKELARLEAEEEKAKKKKTRKPRKTTKPKTTRATTKSKTTGRRTKWRDMKAKMEKDTLDAFM